MVAGGMAAFSFAWATVVREFSDAFVVSELSVLRYEKTALFTGTEGYRHLERLKKDILYRCIYRSLFRTFCEYKLARELPEFGKLLTLLNMRHRMWSWSSL